MNTLLAVIVFAGPWIDSPDFALPMQETVLNATLRLTYATQLRGGQATAVRIGQQGPFVYYLTANHIVEKLETVDLESYSSKSFPKPLMLIPQVDIKKRWPKVDLALLKAIEPDPPGFLLVPKEFVSGRFPYPALSCGCTFGDLPMLAVEQVTRQLRVRKLDNTVGDYWETEKKPVVGRSGGPLVNVNGELIGICSGTDREKGYYVHVGEIITSLRSCDLDRLLVQPAKAAHAEK
jgi:hypothetical protein